jgi:predicted GTPase
MHEDVDKTMLIEKLSRSIAERLQRDTPITLLVVGRIGSGKSSTVNSLLGAELAKVSLHDRGTDHVEMHEGQIHGIHFKIIDTPGFGDPDPEQDDRTLEEITHLSGHFDALLYISPLNQARVDLIDAITIRTLFGRFPEIIWKKSVIVFTKADLVEGDFAEQRDRWANTLQELMIRESGRMPRSKVEAIPIVTISNGHEKRPDGVEWLGELFVTVLERIDRTVAIQFLFSQIGRIQSSEPKRSDTALDLSYINRTSRERGVDSIHLDSAQRSRVREVVRDALVITASATTIGAAVGAAVGGPPGALVGGLIGAGVGITVAAVTTFWDGFKGLFA